MTTTTTIENNELETELQELFLISKQWNADLSFIECELTILNKLFKKASFLLVTSDFNRLSTLNSIHFDLNKRMQYYFQQLEVLILDQKQNIDISLADTYVSLEKDIAQALKRLQAFKNCIFQTNKHQLKCNSNTE
jgi:hypothetical protein